MSKETMPLAYKGRPLRRVDNFIYYGSMSDSHIVLIQILENKTLGDMEVASRLTVQLQRTDDSGHSRDSVVKRSEKDNLYAAIDIASVWLERALANR